MKEAFNALDVEKRGRLSLEDACLACTALLGRRVLPNQLQSLLPQLKGTYLPPQHKMHLIQTVLYTSLIQNRKRNLRT